MRIGQRRLLAVCVPMILGLPLLAQAPPTAEPFTARDMLEVATLSILDIAADGRRVAATARRPVDNAETDHYRFGDATYQGPALVDVLVVETTSGRVARPFQGRVTVPAARWSPDGRQLALIVLEDEPSPGEAGVMRAVGRLRVWDAERGALAPPRVSARIDPSSGLDWTPDGRRVVVALRDATDDDAARARFKALTGGAVIVHSSKDPFLEWDGLRRSASLRALAQVDVSNGTVAGVLPKRFVRSYRVGRDGSRLAVLDDVTDKTDYDAIGGRTSDILVVEGLGASPRKVADGKELKGLELRWSEDARTFAYAKRGEVFVQRVDEEKPRSLTPRASPREGNAGAAVRPGPDVKDPHRDAIRDATKDKEEDESFSPSLLTPDGAKLLVTSKKGWYVIQTATGARAQVVTFDPEHEERNPRLQAIDWTPDGGTLIVGYSAPDRWERGVVAVDAATGTMTPFFKDGRLYRNARLSRDGRTLVFTGSDGDGPDELFVARLERDAAGVTRVTEPPRALTDVNAWTARKALPESELVAYRDADGKELYGVLRYPVGYQKGVRYPTVFEIYETFFDNGLNGRAAFLANHGYAVFHPSVNLVVGRPGEAWLKGVTAAANRLVEMGVADPDRLGVHGTSYGGYATVLLISQTERFKAAINISGKVNMVSFYTDSPRLGVRNTHAPEKSQDRIGGTLWDYPERYLEHSAVLRADRIKTPLLCITGDQDPNVPASQSREIYYALRRLGREVEWVRYANGGHRPPNSVEESIDFEQRILGWYDKYLKASKDAKEAPAKTAASARE